MEAVNGCFFGAGGRKLKVDSDCVAFFNFVLRVDPKSDWPGTLAAIPPYDLDGWDSLDDAQLDVLPA